MLNLLRNFIFKFTANIGRNFKSLIYGFVNVYGIIGRSKNTKRSFLTSNNLLQKSSACVNANNLIFF